MVVDWHSAICGGFLKRDSLGAGRPDRCRGNSPVAAVAVSQTLSFLHMKSRILCVCLGGVGGYDEQPQIAEGTPVWTHEKAPNPLWQRVCCLSIIMVLFFTKPTRKRFWLHADVSVAMWLTIADVTFGLTLPEVTITDLCMTALYFGILRCCSFNPTSCHMTKGCL